MCNFSYWKHDSSLRPYLWQWNVFWEVDHYFYHSTGQIIYAMELADRAIGLLLSVISLSIFTYYTFWVIILPFVETDHFVNKYFPPQEYAILIPVFAGVTLICFLSMFIGYVMLKSKKKKAWIETMCQPLLVEVKFIFLDASTHLIFEYLYGRYISYPCIPLEHC